MEFLESHTTEELLACVLPGDAAHVAADLARQCRFAHGSVMVFPTAEVGELPGELISGPPAPSVVVRGRVARRYGLPEAGLGIKIVHATLPYGAVGDADDIEIFLCPAGAQKMMDDERNSGHETHFALKVIAPDEDRLARLWDLITGPGQMSPDGGGFNPHEGPIGRTVLYFRADGRLDPQGWPRRLELLIDGEHRILATHLPAGSPQEERLPETVTPGDEEPTRRMLELLTGAWATQALCAAAELGVADHLLAGPETSASLARRVGADADLLHRVLRYLGTLGVVRGDDRGWELTELGRTLQTGALRDVARLYGGVFYRSFGSLAHSVRTGSNAFEHALGMAPFDYLNEHPDQAQIFHGAMAAGSSWFGRVPEVINFSGVRTVVDIAGGHGDLLRHILAASPGTQGVLFDQPAVVKAAQESLGQTDLLDRCELVAGDFTEEVPHGGDVYLLSRILHDWDDEQCVRILANCRRAMPETALLVVIERPIPADGTPSLAIAWDVHMSVNNLGGRERTHEEYRRLLRSAGFSLIDARPLALDMAALTAAPTS
ncbi:methyltransferase [Actinomadura sp. DC4]|uniref:methyltransferase n=1 Tax=Actinomadura sp. DC4 TaxID=3055069 RepID=UPI0025AF5618|nr:methyltransferase [Actinomadura sp. DC4]MDN3354136.1 methyltransferase [Actinomadura sp. DC4]